MVEARVLPARRAPARAAQLRSRKRRRSVVLIGAALVVAALMLVAWFPASAIVTQRKDLSASERQLSGMRSQDAALIHAQSALTSPAEVLRLAREEYQLVEQGQRLVQVLPPSGTPTQAGAGPALYPGDPGLSKPVAPSAVALLPTVASAATSASKAGHSATPWDRSLWRRIVATLSFWHR